MPNGCTAVDAIDRADGEHGDLVIELDEAFDDAPASRWSVVPRAPACALPRGGHVSRLSDDALAFS